MSHFLAPAVSNANHNREVMSILPQPLANDLFAIGWKSAAKLRSDCAAARPGPSIDEGLSWIAAARKSALDHAACFLKASIYGADADFEWDDFEWAATRLASEGFEAFFAEARR